MKGLITESSPVFIIRISISWRLMSCYSLWEIWEEATRFYPQKPSADTDVEQKKLCVSSYLTFCWYAWGRQDDPLKHPFTHFKKYLLAADKYRISSQLSPHLQRQTSPWWNARSVTLISWLINAIMQPLCVVELCVFERVCFSHGEQWQYRITMHFTATLFLCPRL